MFGLAGVAVAGKAAVVTDLSATASRSSLPVRRGPPNLRLHGHKITRDDLRRFDPGSGRGARQRRAGHHEQRAAAVRMSSSTAVRMDRSECRKSLKALERVKGIEPSYSAWKSDASTRFFNSFSDKSPPKPYMDFKRQFCAVGRLSGCC